MSLFGIGKPTLYATTQGTITNATYSSGYITLTVADHGYTAGMAVLIQLVEGMTDANGVYEIYDVPTTSTFRIAKTTSQTYTTGGVCWGGEFLEHSIIDYSFVEPDQVEFPSVINGNVTHEHFGDYGTFKVTVLLWKYSPYASNKFLALYNYYHTSVYLLPHSDKAVKDSSGSFVACYLKTFRPFYWKGKRALSAVEMVFTTDAYHSISGLLA